MVQVKAYRIEEDSLGKVNIPSDAYYGINTIRGLENFCLNKDKVNLKLIYAIATVKKASAMANQKLGYLDNTIGNEIINSCDEIIVSVNKNSPKKGRKNPHPKTYFLSLREAKLFSFCFNL